MGEGGRGREGRGEGSIPGLLLQAWAPFLAKDLGDAVWSEMEAAAKADDISMYIRGRKSHGHPDGGWRLLLGAPGAPGALGALGELRGRPGSSGELWERRWLRGSPGRAPGRALGALWGLPGGGARNRKNY